MSIPDVVGLTLLEAEEVLRRAEMIIGKITLISPPRDKSVEYGNNYRVIRAIIKENHQLELQICKPL